MPLEVPPPRSSRFGSPLVVSRVHWVRPEMFPRSISDLGEDNLLRQVVYQGLREDKPAAELRRPVPHPKPIVEERPARSAKAARSKANRPVPYRQPIW